MVQRVLVVTFAQALRSASIVLLPLAFITLVAWATAGSTTGTTSDPIRAAMWIWLGAHHVHFDLSLSPTGVAGSLTYLPIAGLILPILALRSGFKRTIAKLDGDYSNLTGARLFYSLFYAIIAFFIAFFAGSEGVRPVWPLAAIFAFLIALASSYLTGQRISFAVPVVLALRVIALLLALGFAIYATAFFMNFNQGKLITTVLAPGLFGSLLLFILNLLYLPNVAIAALAYISGSGFAVGADTHLSPLTQEIGQIPALPLLAALPVGSQPLILLFSILIIALGALLGYWSLSHQSRTPWQSFFLVFIALGLLGYLASGSLITSAMGAVGVSIWKFQLAIGLELLIGLLAFIYIPRLRMLNR